MAIFKKLTAYIAKITSMFRYSVLDYTALARRLKKSGLQYSLRRDWSSISTDFDSAIQKYEDKLNAKIK